MKYLGLLALAGGAFWFFTKKSENKVATQADQTSLNESNLYKNIPYSVSMGIRG